jgi:hypothetical protein
VAEDRYGLAPLRELRAQGETVRRGNLASAVGDAHVSAAAVATARERTELARAAVRAAYQAREALRTAATLAVADQFLARRRRELDRARDEQLRSELAHDQRTAEVDSARARLARARADRQLVERHFERWRAEQRKAAERKAD